MKLLPCSKKGVFLFKLSLHDFQMVSMGSTFIEQGIYEEKDARVRAIIGTEVQQRSMGGRLVTKDPGTQEIWETLR